MASNIYTDTEGRYVIGVVKLYTKKSLERLKLLTDEILQLDIE